jgi:F-type H+-transporting ATPase subunit epsilon
MSLNVNVSASDKQVWSGDADMLICPTVNGQIGIIEGNGSVMSLLDAGTICISMPSDDNVYTFTKIEVDSGFISVYRNEVNISADSAKIL